MLTDEQLREIRERADAATPGPWLTPVEEGDPYRVHVIDHEGCDVWPWTAETDMVFAYKARTDVPRLLDEIERLRSLVSPVKAHDCNRDHPGQDIYHPQA